MGPFVLRWREVTSPMVSHPPQASRRAPSSRRRSSRPSRASRPARPARPRSIDRRGLCATSKPRNEPSQPTTPPPKPATHTNHRHTQKPTAASARRARETSSSVSPLEREGGHVPVRAVRFDPTMTRFYTRFHDAIPRRDATTRCHEAPRGCRDEEHQTTNNERQNNETTSRSSADLGREDVGAVVDRARLDEEPLGELRDLEVEPSARRRGTCTSGLGIATTPYE